MAWTVQPSWHDPIDGIPRLRRAECQVLWATPRHRRSWHEGLLHVHERARLGRLRHGEDRDRFCVGVALTRIVLGFHLGMAPAQVPIDRTCSDCGAPHGKPRLSLPAPLEFSISHSADRVVLAIASCGDSVGVDVEEHAAVADPAGLSRLVLSPSELAHYTRLDARPGENGLLRYWTRKEAVVKATGDGLNEPLLNVSVSAPDCEPVLLHWVARPHLPPLIDLHDLDPGDGYLASLAVFGEPCAVAEIDAGSVLRAGAQRA